MLLTPKPLQLVAGTSRQELVKESRGQRHPLETLSNVAFGDTNGDNQFAHDAVKGSDRVDVESRRSPIFELGPLCKCPEVRG